MLNISGANTCTDGGDFWGSVCGILVCGSSGAIPFGIEVGKGDVEVEEANVDIKREKEVEEVYVDADVAAEKRGMSRLEMWH